jgi:DNA-binding MarR family transcriptional regulator
MARTDYSHAHDLARSVARLSRRLRQERRSELTPSQLSVLGTVCTSGPSTPGAVAALERVQPPTMTRALNSLVDAGLILRTPHPDDGRQVLVAVSAAGEKVLTEERTRRDVWLAEQLRALTPAQRAHLDEAAVLLEQIADA